jgi:hypothetical protein
MDRISYCATSRHAAPTANGSSACLSCDSLVFALDLLQSAFDKQFIAIHQRQASMRSGIDRFSPDDMIGVNQDFFAIVSFSLHQHWVSFAIEEAPAMRRNHAAIILIALTGPSSFKKMLWGPSTTGATESISLPTRTNRRN